jgi:hypothetical protein
VWESAVIALIVNQPFADRGDAAKGRNLHVIKKIYRTLERAFAPIVQNILTTECHHEFKSLVRVWLGRRRTAAYDRALEQPGQ